MQGVRRHKSDGVPPAGAEGTFEFKSKAAKRVFEHLLGSFIDDYMRRRLSPDDSGWRSLPHLAGQMKIPTSTMYGKHGGIAPDLGELIRRGLVEARTFTRQRGRGGEVIRMRIAYGTDPVADIVRARIASPSERETASKSFLPINRLAVLPFISIGPDASDEYVADGLTEELTGRLSQIMGLDVISRASMMTFKKSEKKVFDIGKELRAGTLIEGSIRRSGNRIRVSVQLVDANTSGHLWAATYDRDMDDILAIQADVAEHVAQALRVELLPGEERSLHKKTKERTDAYLLYFKSFVALSLRQVNREELLQFVRSIKEGGHVCLIYEDERLLWDLEAEYLKRGIGLGYLGLVETMKDDELKIREALVSRGVDIERHVKEGSLMVSVWDQEQISGVANAEAELESAKKFVSEVLKKGKKGLYDASNINNQFLRSGFSDQLFALEKAARMEAGFALPNSHLCCYDVSEIAPPERPLALKQLLEHHRRIAGRNPKLMGYHNLSIFLSGGAGVIAELPEV